MLLAGASTVLFGQQLPEKGVPLLENYSPAEYDHKGKIWDIDSAPNGIVYMASDKGLLEYDGNRWKSYRGSEGVTRSVWVVNDSLIYTGSDLDFGVWERTIYNDFEYRSLYPFKEDLSEINEEFWGVHYLNGIPYFVSASNVYVYRDGSLTKIPAPNEINNSFQLGDSLFLVDEEDGVFELNDLSPRQLFSMGGSRFDVSGMYEDDEGYVLVTQSSGLFRYSNGEFSRMDSRLSETLERANVFSFEKIDDSHFAFGTILQGVYISNGNGEIIHHINKGKGLQNNTILSLHHSDAGKLWISMDFGVSNLDLGTEFSFFYDYMGDFGTGNSAILDNGTFYLGTNQGLYRSGWDDLNNNEESFEFNLVPDTEGQVWTLQEIGGDILMGHDRGLFVLGENGINRLGGRRGIWTLEEYGDYLLAGTYNGIIIYTKTTRGWEYLKQMDLIVGSSNQVLIENDNILWVNIPTYGIVRATLNEELNPENRELFRSAQFDGSDHLLRRENGEVVVETVTKRFLYDESTGSFQEEDREEQNLAVDNLLLRNARPAQLNDHYEFYPVYNGFALRDLRVRGDSAGPAQQLIFRNFEALNNEEVITTHNGAAIPYEFNNLRLELIVPNKKEVRYQYRTAGDGRWSDWSDSNTIELIGLSPGRQQISARALVDGEVTPVRSISLTILSPWYLSWFAIGVYVLLFMLVVYLAYIWQERSLNKQKKSLLDRQRSYLNEQKERHRQQLKKVEKKKLQAEYEQLKAQFKSKTIELATKAKENDEKNRILLSLKEKFEKLEQQPESLPHRLSEIQQMIDSHIHSDDNTFEIQIDELHQEFFDTLRQKFPELTRYDLRLCAYIKIGFDSKEISDLLNIKPSSVYISRSRLRKKLGIDSDDDLHAFLNSV